MCEECFIKIYNRDRKEMEKDISVLEDRKVLNFFGKSYNARWQSRYNRVYRDANETNSLGGRI